MPEFHQKNTFHIYEMACTVLSNRRIGNSNRKEYLFINFNALRMYPIVQYIAIRRP